MSCLPAPGAPWYAVVHPFPRRVRCPPSSLVDRQRTMMYSDFSVFGYYPHFPPNAPRAPNSAMTVNRTLSRVVLSLLLLPILSGCGWFKAKKDPLETLPVDQRSEERRVGKECVSKCRSRW